MVNPKVCLIIIVSNILGVKHVKIRFSPKNKTFFSYLVQTFNHIKNISVFISFKNKNCLYERSAT